jgi:hypothetical protein
MEIKNNLSFCCNLIENFLNKSLIEYEPKYREFIIGTYKKHGYFKINYCPFCGKKFLEDLYDEYINELQKIFKNKKLIDIETMEDFKKPEEFRTDEWWIKRGL